MPKCAVLNEPALSIISKHFETFDERGAQMVPKVFLYQIKSKFFPAKSHKNERKNAAKMNRYILKQFETKLNGGLYSFSVETEI